MPTNDRKCKVVDLTEHGDVEPHPGPRNNHKHWLNGTKFCMANVASGDNLRYLMPIVNEKKIGVIATRENRCDDFELAKLETFCRQNFGYIFRRPKGTATVIPKGAIRDNQGIGLLVHTSLHCVPAGKIFCNDAQAVFA